MEKAELFIDLFFIISISAVITNLFGFLLINHITLFGWMMVNGSIGVIFIFVFVASLIRMKKNRSRWIKEITPLIVSLSTLVLMITLPTKFNVWIEFKMYESKRNEVIEIIKEGDLEKGYRKTDGELLLLPPKLRYLSDGGEIIINPSKTIFFFYSYRGILDNYNGFIFVFDKNVNSIKEVLEDYNNIIQMNEHWYWINS